MTPFVFDTYDLRPRLPGRGSPTRRPAGLVTRTPPTRRNHRVERRLRIVYPAGMLALAARSPAPGGCPWSAIVHGQHGDRSDRDCRTPNLERLRGTAGRAGTTGNRLGFGRHQRREHLQLADRDAGADGARRAGQRYAGMDADPSSRLHGAAGPRPGRAGRPFPRRRRGRPGRADQRVAASRDQVRHRARSARWPRRTSPSARSPARAELTSKATRGFYAVVYGALDGDVAGQGGARVSAGPASATTTAPAARRRWCSSTAATHNRFNSQWAADGDESGVVAADRAPGGRLLPVADQPALLDEYVGGLCRWRLLGDTAPADAVRRHGTNTLKAGVSLQWSFGATDRAARRHGESDQAAHAHRRLHRPVPGRAGRTLPSRRRRWRLETDHVTTVLALEPPLVSGEAYSISLAPGQSDWTQFSALDDQRERRLRPDRAGVDHGRPAARVQCRAHRRVRGQRRDRLDDVRHPQAPSRPVFHQHSSGENCTVLRLETMALPISSIPTVDPAGSHWLG